MSALKISCRAYSIKRIVRTRVTKRATCPEFKIWPHNGTNTRPRTDMKTTAKTTASASWVTTLASAIDDVPALADETTLPPYVPRHLAKRCLIWVYMEGTVTCLKALPVRSSLYLVTRICLESIVTN